jgi:hypothetical protein
LRVGRRFAGPKHRLEHRFERIGHLHEQGTEPSAGQHRLHRQVFENVLDVMAKHRDAADTHGVGRTFERMDQPSALVQFLRPRLATDDSLNQRRIFAGLMRTFGQKGVDQKAVDVVGNVQNEIFGTRDGFTRRCAVGTVVDFVDRRQRFFQCTGRRLIQRLGPRRSLKRFNQFATIHPVERRFKVTEHKLRPTIEQLQVLTCNPAGREAVEIFLDKVAYALQSVEIERLHSLRDSLHLLGIIRARFINVVRRIGIGETSQARRHRVARFGHLIRQNGENFRGRHRARSTA